MSDILTAFKWPTIKPRVQLPKEFLQEMRALRPGRVLKIEGYDGSEIAVLDYDDFIHIMLLAGLGDETQREPNA